LWNLRLQREGKQRCTIFVNKVNRRKYNKQIHNFYYSPNNNRAIKSGKGEGRE
jgi:hypothetical protein